MTNERLAYIKRRHKIYEEGRARAPSSDDYMQAFVCHGHRKELLDHIDALNAELEILREQDWRQTKPSFA